MTSITITKPAKWSWASGSIVDPDDATNLYLCEPFWAVDDWTIPNATSGTHSDLTGSKTLTFTMGDDNSFAWDTDANAGAFIDRVERFANGNGMRGPTGELSSATDLTFIYVLRWNDDSGNGVRFFGGLRRFGFAIDTATGQVLIVNNSAVTVYTSTLTVPKNEWHVLGVRVDIDGDMAALCLDGGTIESGSASLFALDTNSAATCWYSDTHGAAVPLDTADFAFWAVWTAGLADARFQDLCDPANGNQGPYRLITEAGGGGDPTGNPYYAYVQQ